MKAYASGYMIPKVSRLWYENIMICLSCLIHCSVHMQKSIKDLGNYLDLVLAPTPKCTEGPNIKLFSKLGMLLLVFLGWVNMACGGPSYKSLKCVKCFRAKRLTGVA
jgi:hypothetical protein